MCKHVMKVFMMKHPAIDKGLIIREAALAVGWSERSQWRMLLGPPSKTATAKTK